MGKNKLSSLTLQGAISQCKSSLHGASGPGIWESFLQPGAALPPQLTESHQVTQFQLSLPHNDISTVYWERGTLTKMANRI